MELYLRGFEISYSMLNFGGQTSGEGSSYVKQGKPREKVFQTEMPFKFLKNPLLEYEVE